jgi:hypothetical protein
VVRATILHYLMPALCSSTDGAPGLSRHERLARLARGEFEELVPALLAHARVLRRVRRREETEAALNADVQHYLAMPGGLRKAAQVLQPVGVAAGTDACLAEMQAKFPPAAAGEAPADLRAAAAALLAAAAALPPELELLRQEGFRPEDMARCVQKAHYFSGPGPSGLRHSHLQDGLRTRWGRRHLPMELSLLAKLIVHESASLPDLFWALHIAARLTPLEERQRDGTLKRRPIACGDVLQRLTMSVYVSDHKTVLAELMERHGQYGVAVASGAEKGAMFGRMEYEGGKWQLALDMRNAFGEMLLMAIARWVAAQLPDLLGYFVKTYLHNRPRLLFRHADGSMRVIVSQRGVKQGDPVAPVLFCAGMDAVLKDFNLDAAAQGALRRITAFMDDTRPGLGVDTLQARDVIAVRELTARFAGVGLTVNFNKSCALPGKGHVVTAAERQLLAEHLPGIALAGGDEDDAQRGMVLLGAPLGNPAFIDAWLRAESGAAGGGAQFAKRVARLTSPRAMTRLLRSCVVPRMTYTLRTLPPERTADAAAAWDEVVRWVLERALGLHSAAQSWEEFVATGKPYALTDVQLQQARLPAKDGGLGVSSAAATAAAAYTAGALASVPAVLSAHAGALAAVAAHGAVGVAAAAHAAMVAAQAGAAQAAAHAAAAHVGVQAAVAVQAAAAQAVAAQAAAAAMGAAPPDVQILDVVPQDGAPAAAGVPLLGLHAAVVEPGLSQPDLPLVPPAPAAPAGPADPGGAAGGAGGGAGAAAAVHAAAAAAGDDLVAAHGAAAAADVAAAQAHAAAQAAVAAAAAAQAAVPAAAVPAAAQAGVPGAAAAAALLAAPAVERGTLRGAPAAAVAALPCMRSLVAAAAQLRQELGDGLGGLVPVALLAALPAPAPPPDANGGAAAAVAAAPALDVEALQVQCGMGAYPQTHLTAALAEVRAGVLDAALRQIPEETPRLQALARFRSLRHRRSIGTAFLNAPMGADSGAFDGLAWYLALRRVLGVEQPLPACGLCAASPGGTLHARFCRAVCGHVTRVHDRVKRATCGILQRYLRVSVEYETHKPFVATGQLLLRMDLLLPAHAFPVTGFNDATHHRQLQVDVSSFEAQCPTHLPHTAVNPEQPCLGIETTKKTHYSPHYDRNCYSLATLALGSFGALGAEGRQLLDAVATEWSAKETVPGAAGPKALKGIALSRMRATLSVALHMSLSERVLEYMASPGVRGAAGQGVGAVVGEVLGWEDVPWGMEA